ncbi:GxxExxY protein [Draconibacterium orientale]|uniref:GxxExxY protein n=2 Tax=Draconibacterium orientale TaxID=1168034 RepID=A0A1H9Y4S4_9BACT|nr:GxxExxY protein [Draconibacterium orientale]SES63765.1 GxxExxY protein [Draconibacterium orientale]
MMTQKIVNAITYDIIGCAIEVHKELGPGLLESVYEKCLGHVLQENGMKVEYQKAVPVNFRGLKIDADLRFDILVEALIGVELKAVQDLLPIHEAQLLTYLKLLEKPKGILINFNCTNIYREGQKTFVTEHFRKLPKE